MRKHLSALQSEHDTCDVYETMLHIRKDNFWWFLLRRRFEETVMAFVKQLFAETQSIFITTLLSQTLKHIIKDLHSSFLRLLAGVPFLIIYCSLAAIEPPVNLPRSKGILPTTAVYINYYLLSHSSNTFLSLHCIIITIKLIVQLRGSQILLLQLIMRII